MRNNIITSVLNKASVLLNFKEISLALLLLLVLASPGNLYAQDSDGDGVADTQDLDSDNDGILDADEGRCIANIGSIVVNTSSGEIASYNVETGVSTIICTGVGGAFDIAMPADASVYYLLTSAGGISSVDPSTCNSTFLEDVGGGTFNSLSILPDGT
ncbi:MAG: hypothetical protein AB8B65_19740, partial [Kordia sp.]|uniref:hypothetical protein n=1 Tax=Kordia sp. TaxID=1965332 RepID=UPI0038580769